MLHWIKCIYAASILALWIFSVIVLILATLIRDNLSVVALVTENTSIGDFYLKTFFPVIFPILITLACFIFVIGCIGYCGVFTNSQTLLGWFFFSLLVTFCVELSAGVWRIIEYDLSYNETDFIQLKKNIKLYTGLKNTPNWFKDSWTEIHHKFDCCGVDSYKDWISNDYQILKTCCPTDVSNGACPIMILGTKGCGNDLFSYLNSSKYMGVLPYITGIMGVVQVLAMLLTLKIWLEFCLKSKGKSETTYPQIIDRRRLDEKQFYEIEMESKNGRACYITPSIAYKDTRVYAYSAAVQGYHGMSSQSPLHHVIRPVADKEEASDDVTDRVERLISSRSCSKTDSIQSGETSYEQRQKTWRVAASSLTRRDAASDAVRQVRSSTTCTCSLGCQRVQPTSTKLRLDSNSLQHEEQQKLKERKSQPLLQNRSTRNQTMSSLRTKLNASRIHEVTTPLLNELTLSGKQDFEHNQNYISDKKSSLNLSSDGSDRAQTSCAIETTT